MKLPVRATLFLRISSTFWKKVQILHSLGKQITPLDLVCCPQEQQATLSMYCLQRPARRLHSTPGRVECGVESSRVESLTLVSPPAVLELHCSLLTYSISYILSLCWPSRAPQEVNDVSENQIPTSQNF
jgi:hypothetical protein